MKYLSLIVFVVLATAWPAQAQVWHRLGGWGAFNAVEHTGSFQPMSYMNSCCKEYTTAYDQWISAGPSVEWAALSTTLVGVRVGYTVFDASFTSSENVRVVVDDTQQDGVIRNTLAVSLGALPIMAYVKQQVVGPLFVAMGGQYIIVPNPTYTTFEEIVSPSNVVYNTRTQSSISNNTRGDMRDASSYLSLFGMIQVEIPLDKQKMYLVIPTVSATYGMQDYAKVNWKINSFQVGIAFMWQYGKFIEEQRRDELRKSAPAKEGDGI